MTVSHKTRHVPIFIDHATLADALRAAKDAHTAWEAEHGPDADWPAWYADYIVTRQIAAHEAQMRDYFARLDAAESARRSGA